jgi:hypothetical protein
MIEVLYGETPNGGVSSDATYLDGSMIPCDKEKASNIMIREFDKEGNIIKETWGKIG